MNGIRSGPGSRVLTLVWVVVLSALFTPSFSAAQTSPHLKLVGVIRTTPFVHTQISMRDGEGSAYVPRDHSLWLAYDGTDAIFEVAPRTGIQTGDRGEAFRSAHRFGGGPRAGQAVPTTSRAWRTTRRTTLFTSSLVDAARERSDRQSSG